MGKYLRKRKRNKGTAVLAIAAVTLTVVLVFMILSLDRGDDPEPAALKATRATEASEPTAAPTEPPTEPPKFMNEYDEFDFIYDGEYLTQMYGESVMGIDVSIYQGEIDWEQVKEAGVEFVMIRLGYRGYGTGKIVEDANFRTNLEGAAEAGLDVGVYFFSQAISEEEAIEEADFVLDTLAGYPLTMPIAYDWEYIDEDARTAEVDRRTLTDCSLAFLKKIEKTGYRPMLYYNTNQVRKLLHLSELEQYDSWLALYTDVMTFPYRIKMWQYTCEGKVPGIEGNVDINLYFPNV